MSAGLQMPSFGELSPEMQAQILRMLQTPAVGSPEVPDATPPGFSGFTPPDAPTDSTAMRLGDEPAATPSLQDLPLPPSMSGAPVQAMPAFDSPLVASLSGAPPASAGQAPAPQADAPPPAPVQIPSMLGAPAPIVPQGVPAQADAGVPSPQTTGALPKPPATAKDDGEEEAPAPAVAPASPAGLASRAVPLPPARPSDLSALGDAGMSPVNSFDPLTGQPVSGSPKPVGAPAAPAAAPAAHPDDHSFLKAWKALADSGFGDQLLALGSGILQGQNFGDGLGKGFERMLSVSQASGKVDAEKAKLAREQAAALGNAAIYKKYFPNATPEEALAGGSNSSIMTELMKRGLPPTETYATETDKDGNLFSVNKQNGQKSLILKADEDKKQTPLTTEEDRAAAGIPADDSRPAWKDANGKVTFSNGPELTADIRNWQEAKRSGGYKGSLQDWITERANASRSQTNVNVDLAKKAAGEADAQILKKIDTSYDKAQGAIDTLGAISRQKQALDQGIIAGWGSNFRTNAQAMAEQLLGITPDEKLDPTYTFEAASKQKGAALAKAISQSGHTTNMDLNLGNSIAGGDRDKTERALRQIIDAQEILATDTIKRHNGGVDRYVGSHPEQKDQMSWYHVDPPGVYQYGQGKPIPVADPGAVPAPVTKTLNGRTYMRGPDGHWYVGGQ